MKKKHRSESYPVLAGLCDGCELNPKGSISATGCRVGNKIGGFITVCPKYQPKKGST